MPSEAEIAALESTWREASNAVAPQQEQVGRVQAAAQELQGTYHQLRGSLQVPCGLASAIGFMAQVEAGNAVTSVQSQTAKRRMC